MFPRRLRPIGGGALMRRLWMASLVYLGIVLAPLCAGAAPGDLDTSFGTGGKVVTPIGTGSDGGHAVAIDGSGRIVVAGWSSNGTDDDFAVARYTASGSLDAT